MDIIFGTLQDAFFAAIASVGFASISNPPHRIYPVCAGIAAVGHSLRYVLMNATGMHLVLASLCAATVIGLLAVFLAPDLDSVTADIEVECRGTGGIQRFRHGLPVTLRGYGYGELRIVRNLVLRSRSDSLNLQVDLPGRSVIILAARGEGQQGCGHRH